MKAETRRQRAEFAAQLRVFSPKDPPILTTESVNDLCAVFHDDAKARRRIKKLLSQAEVLADSLNGHLARELQEVHEAILDALGED